MLAKAPTPSCKAFKEELLHKSDLPIPCFAYQAPVRCMVLGKTLSAKIGELPLCGRCLDRDVWAKAGAKINPLWYWQDKSGEGRAMKWYISKQLCSDCVLVICTRYIDSL